MADRHFIDLKLARSGFERVVRLWPILFQRAKTGSEIGSLPNWALTYAAQLCFFEPQSSQITNLLMIAADASCANFQLAQTNNAGLEIRLGDEVVHVSISSRSIPAHASPFDWIRAFFAAAIARRREAMEELCRIEASVFPLNSSTRESVRGLD
jgi:hypothetical protein